MQLAEMVRKNLKINAEKTYKSEVITKKKDIIYKQKYLRIFYSIA